MKSCLTLFLSFCFLSSSFSQIDWAQEGTQWWYLTQDVLFGDIIDSKEYEVTGQEMVGGKLCQMVQSEDGDYFTYEENNRVFIWDEINEEFYLRFDWNKQIGETYDCSFDTFNLTCTVTDIDAVGIEGTAYQRQFVEIINNNNPNALPAFEQVVNFIGSYRQFATPLPSEIIVEIFYGLACFDTPFTNLNSTEYFTISCNDIVNPVWEADEERYHLAISPNPSFGQIQVKYMLPSAEGNIHLYHSIGLHLNSHSIKNEIGTVMVNDLSPGLYLAILEIDGKPIRSEKIVVH